MTMNSLMMATAALVAVLALVLLAQRAARWSGLAQHTARWGGLAPRPTGGGRLALVEAVALDPRRRLCLVRCDDRHVLLLTGGTQDLVVGWVEREPAPGGPA